jgi:cell division protein FtsN
MVLPPGWNEAADTSGRSGSLRFIFGSRSDIELVVSLGRRRAGLEGKSLVELVREDLAEQGGTASTDIRETRIGSTTVVRVRRSTRRSEELHVIIPSGDVVFQFAYLTPTLAAFEAQGAAIEAAVATVVPGRELDASDAASRKRRYLSVAGDLEARGDYVSASGLLDSAAEEFPEDADVASARRRLGARALVMPALALSNQVIDPGLDVSALASAPRPRATVSSPGSEAVEAPVAGPVAATESLPVKTEQAAPVKTEQAAPARTEQAAPVKIEQAAPVRTDEPAPVRTEIAAATKAQDERASASALQAAGPPSTEKSPAKPPPSAATEIAEAPAPASPEAEPILTIQVGAFRSQANAESLRARAAATIPEAYLTEADVNGARVYRVRVGRFASLRTAREAESTLRAAGFDCVMLPLARGD